MKKILLIITAMFIASTVKASTPIWISSQIKWIYPLADGSIVLKFVNDSPSCTNSSKYHYIKNGENGMTQEGIDRIHSLLLSSAVQKRIVNVNFDSESSICAVNRAYVTFN